METKDAERYRVLRGSGYFAPAHLSDSGWALSGKFNKYTAAELDKAVDDLIVQIIDTTLKRVDVFKVFEREE